MDNVVPCTWAEKITSTESDLMKFPEKVKAFPSIIHSIKSTIYHTRYFPYQISLIYIPIYIYIYIYTIIILYIPSVPRYRYSIESSHTKSDWIPRCYAPDTSADRGILGGEMDQVSWQMWKIWRHAIRRMQGWECIYIYIYNWLVVSNMIFMFHNIWDVILPIDFHIFFRGVGIPPTR